MNKLIRKTPESMSSEIRARIYQGTVPSASHVHTGTYVRVATADSITAQHTFAPGSSQAPFVLGANAQSQLVTGLRADELNKAVTAGDGLTGGGTLTAGITLNLDTPGTVTVASSNSASGNHTHAVTSSSNPGAAASLLASSASGELTLQGLTVDNIDIDGNTVAVTGNLLVTISAAGTAIVRSTATGATAVAGADDLVIDSGQSGVDGGLSILTLGNAYGNIVFGAPADTRGAVLKWKYNDNALSIGTALASGVLIFMTGDEAEAARLSGTKLLINETVDTNLTTGVCVNQGAADDNAFTGKSSDVGHGMTTDMEADTWVSIRKVAASAGGAKFSGWRDADSSAYRAVVLEGNLGEAADTTKSAAGHGIIELDAKVISGSTVGAAGSDANLWSLANNGSTVIIGDAEGELHLDATVSENAWDDYDDILLLKGLRASITPGMGARFAHFVEYARPVLEKTGVATYNADGHHFVALKALHMLEIDTLWQLHERLLALERGLERR